MVFVLGLFLLNTLCALVPCQKFYEPPVPVPLTEKNVPPDKLYDSENSIFKNSQNGMDSDNEDFTPDPVVTTFAGTVRGYRMQTIRARNIYAFTSIPYAEPPLGNLRYRAPVAKQPWKGIYDASRPAPHCLQISALQQLRIIGKEDCLFLNIYTPQLPKFGQKLKIPVMVYIHGGSFAFGSGAIFGPAYLLDRNVILVTLNYRLSSFGFLSTGDDAASGNWGLKDQNLALRWVKKNIKFFGGDPGRITLFGQSAGGASVHLHMLSHRSHGLFQAAISQSGSAFCFWAVRNDSIDFTYRLAARLRCPVNDSRLTVECLRRTDAHLIVYHEATIPEFTLFPGVFFGPIVEGPGPNSFLEDWPLELYNKKQVPPIPWISGYLALEGNGLAFLTYLYPRAIQEINRRWSELAHLVLDIRQDNFRLVTEATDAIRKYYMDDHDISFYTRMQMSSMYGDRLITTGVHLGLQLHPHAGPTYAYFFNYTGRYSTSDSFGLNVKDWGLSHDDDLMYLMNSTTYEALRVGDPEYEMSEFLVNIWVNFATKGVPVYTTDDGEDLYFWTPVRNTSDVEMVRFDGDFPVMIKQPFADRMMFWENLGLLSDSHVGPFYYKKPPKYTLISTKSSTSTSLSHIQ